MTSTSIINSKAIVWDFWKKLNDCKPGQLRRIIGSYVREDISWHGPHPINDLNGVEALIKGFWQPFYESFPNAQRKSDIFIGGYEHWVAAIGYFKSTFAHDWLGIPATGREMNIRFGEFSSVYQGKIAATYIILDVLDVMRQAGFQLVKPGLGEESIVPGPITGDGVFFDSKDNQEGAKTLVLVKTMCGVLNTPDCANYWNTDTMMWYGPCGIGTTRTMKGFEDKHQTPFNHAFPAYGSIKMGVHAAEVGEGNYAAWVGWPSIHASLSGEYLGCPPTGQMVDWRLMDFYRREGDLIIENWVPVDMIYLFKLMGLDVFDKLKNQIKIKKEK
jgi:predicted ester cyclase